MTWVKYRRERPDALARLFCLPFAGGTALTYARGFGLAPPELEVCPIQLPGRDDRAHHDLHVRMADLLCANLPMPSNR